MHTTDSGEVKMEMGDTITLPAGLPHRARNIGDRDAVLIIAYPTAHREWSSDEPR
jgi:quercetin dioxygenase-like cupin family protein